MANTVHKTVLLLSSMVLTSFGPSARAEAPHGTVTPGAAPPPSSNLNGAKPPSGTSNAVTAANQGDLETQHHQSLREELIANMVQTLKARNPSFQTLKETVEKRIAAGSVTTSIPAPAPTLLDSKNLPPALKNLADAAKKVRDTKIALAQFPDLAIDLEKTVAEFEKAAAVVGSLDKNALTLDLVLLGLNTVEKAAILEMKRETLLPTLLMSFVNELGVFGAIKHSQPVGVDQAKQVDLLQKRLGEVEAKLAKIGKE